MQIGLCNRKIDIIKKHRNKKGANGKINIVCPAHAVHGFMQIFVLGHKVIAHTAYGSQSNQDHLVSSCTFKSLMLYRYEGVFSPIRY